MAAAKFVWTAMTCAIYFSKHVDFAHSGWWWHMVADWILPHAEDKDHAAGTNWGGNMDQDSWHLGPGNVVCSKALDCDMFPRDLFTKTWCSFNMFYRWLVQSAKFFLFSQTKILLTYILRYSMLWYIIVHHACFAAELPKLLCHQAQGIWRVHTSWWGLRAHVESGKVIHPSIGQPWATLMCLLFFSCNLICTLYTLPGVTTCTVNYFDAGAQEFLNIRMCKGIYRVRIFVSLIYWCLHSCAHTRTCNFFQIIMSSLFY